MKRLTFPKFWLRWTTRQIIETEIKQEKQEAIPEAVIEFNGENLYEFTQLREVVGVSELSTEAQKTGESYLMLRGKGIIKIEKGFQLEGTLRQNFSV
jgi:hypothetical protein